MSDVNNINNKNGQDAAAKLAAAAASRAAKSVKPVKLPQQTAPAPQQARIPQPAQQPRNAQPVQAEEAPVKRRRKMSAGKKRVILLRISFIMILLLAAALAYVTFTTRSEIASMKRRIAESEDYIAAANSRIYQYAMPSDILHFKDKTYGEMWLAPLENVPLCTYDYDGLELGPDKRYLYRIGGDIMSKTGIDVSYHNGDIDWEQVYLDGIDFVMIRVGYRGYESGLMKEDERAREYIEGALKAGLDVGAYFYSQAVSEAEAAEEARFVCGLLSDYRITYPVVFDWELPDDESARTVGISTETLNKCAASFCGEVATQGYTPMIYSNLALALCKFDMRGLYVYDLWYVEYKDGHNPPAYPYDFQMWQYASDGRVKGIEGDVDMNICFFDYRKQYDATHE